MPRDLDIRLQFIHAREPRHKLVLFETALLRGQASDRRDIKFDCWKIKNWETERLKKKL